MKVNVNYKYPEDYHPKYVNGAYGGVTARDEIIINFFLERFELPEQETHDVNLGKTIKVQKREGIEKTVVRDISSGVILKYDVAKEIHRWFGELIKSIEQKTKNDE